MPYLQMAKVIIFVGITIKIHGSITAEVFSVSIEKSRVQYHRYIGYKWCSIRYKIQCENVYFTWIKSAWHGKDFLNSNWPKLNDFVDYYKF